jgi:hypothetical protein
MLSYRTKMEQWPLKKQGTDPKCDCSRTDHYGNKVHYMAEDMMRRARKMMHNALDVDVRPFWLYIRLKNGRRCSCFSGSNVEPNGECQTCFGTGFVGGYEKFGTHSELIDPSCRYNAVNVYSEISNNGTIPCIQLCDTATFGYLETSIEIGNNRGEVDYYREYYSGVNSSARIKVFVKPSNSHYSYSESSDKIIEDFLKEGFRKLDFKIEFSRSNLSCPSPKLYNVWVRYRIRPEKDRPEHPGESYTLKCDIPPAQTTETFDQNGGSNSMFTNLTVVTDPMVYNNYTADDCLYELGEYNNGKELRWKIYQVEKLSQVNSLTSTKLETTLVMDYEPFNKFPI